MRLSLGFILVPTLPCRVCLLHELFLSVVPVPEDGVRFHSMHQLEEGLFSLETGLYLRDGFGVIVREGHLWVPANDGFPVIGNRRLNGGLFKIGFSRRSR